ncbi:MAG: glycosyltransferase family 9 protein [Hydrococcus sp. RM1_1_31]|nr:glycosyltransferase family 9 protein [Hydrococcus sp. RM1_1_31]
MNIESDKNQFQSDSHPSKRILLGQLGANGDCLNATTLARQIKYDYPDCYLTWAVSSSCRGMVENNPFVDEIWEVPVAPGESMPEVWNRFESDVRKCVLKGQFDEVFLTQIYPNNF